MSCVVTWWRSAEHVGLLLALRKRSLVRRQRWGLCGPALEDLEICECAPLLSGSWIILSFRFLHDSGLSQFLNNSGL